MVKRFEIHAHTEYSNLRLLDSINKPKRLIDRAIELGLSGIAITDHEALCGHVVANKYAQEVQKEHPDFEMFTPHCFRHSFATRAIENGMQPKTLQKIMGHGSLQMTMDLYCHVTNDTLFDAMKLMEKAM